MTPAEHLIQSMYSLLKRKATNPYYKNQFLYTKEIEAKIKFIKRKEGIK